MNAPQPLRVLMVEDSEDDAELNLHTLRRAGIAVCGHRVEEFAELHAALATQEWDIVLSDHSLPRLTSTMVLRYLQATGATTPCIIVSGNIGEEAAVDALRAGAVDFVNKELLSRLAPAVERALREVAERRGRLAAEAQVRASEQRFRALVQHSTDLIAVVSPAGTPIYVSPSIEHLLGFSPEEVLTTNFWEVIDADKQLAGRFLTSVLGEPGSSVTGEFATTHKDGSTRWFDVVATNLAGDPCVQGIILNGRDITERRSFEGQLRHQALHDALTGLPNRALFLDRLAQTLREPRRSGQRVAVLAVDLDRFKVINDTFGHPAGDRILIEIAARLERCLDPGDTLARCGEDEFAILVRPESERVRAVAVAERVRLALAAPISIDGQEGVVTASIGIAFAAADAAAQPDDLLRDADVALYQAKAAGRNTYVLYQPSMNARPVERWQLENDLRKAIDRGELVLHFQPIVDSATGRVMTVEALVRWQHPVRGLLPPGEFISLAEETGLVVPIGEWVLAEACRWLRGWQSAHPGYGHLAIAVNLSARQFRQPSLVKLVGQILQEAMLPPSALELEITEQSLIEDVDAAARTFLGLRGIGVQLAIDDFGIGFCSLTHLRRFSAGLLKIDRSFARALLPSDAERPLLGLMLSLGHTLGMGVTMEGIETIEQADAARDMGFDREQGYYFARPLDRQSAEAFLARQPVVSVTKPRESRLAIGSGLVSALHRPAPATYSFAASPHANSGR